MSTNTPVFAGNAATAYAAFNLRDSYYPDMARLVIKWAKARLRSPWNLVVDLGAGIGMSTMEILKEVTPKGLLFAVEPEEAMRYFAVMNTMGDPRVKVLEGKGENLSSVVNGWNLNLVVCCQAMHLFNPPGKESAIPKVLREIADSLSDGGVVAFDLGPSNFEFALPLADHRSGEIKHTEVMTELAHPLYQRMHEILMRNVKREFPDFDRENLWPAAAARMNYQFLSEACAEAGLRDLEVHEELSPVSGQRVINFIRNGWTVFFRWGQLAELPVERKLSLMNQALSELFRQSDFAALSTVMSYHPTAVFTAVKF